MNNNTFILVMNNTLQKPYSLQKNLGTALIAGAILGGKPGTIQGAHFGLAPQKYLSTFTRQIATASSQELSPIVSGTIRGVQQISHPFHLVDPSPWPIFAAIGAFTTTFGAVMFMHGYIGGNFTLSLGFAILLYSMFVWWRDVIREATFEGHHTLAVQTGLRMGMILFIVSEIMFFLAFFWTFFHSSLAPTIEIGAVWPPKGLEVLNPWEVPFLNTLILLTSGAAVTWCHHAILAGHREQAIYSLLATIILACFFTGFQVLEYLEAPFNISDSVYGSTFYIATGFHGFHVFVGTAFLAVCLIRLIQHHFTKKHHFGFEAAAWYWHFVDVVWLFLFVTIYWWGGV